MRVKDLIFLGYDSYRASQICSNVISKYTLKNSPTVTLYALKNNPNMMIYPLKISQI